MSQNNPIVLILAVIGAFAGLFLLSPIALDLVGPAQEAIDQTRGAGIGALAMASVKKIGLDAVVIAGSAFLGGTGGAIGGDYVVKNLG